ncbi:partitioning protein (plasmid) [Acinetobacter sp. NCu2D-2]|uniref:ParB/RepB/Spo0J family partition protein n=1 Tax=Acinetobacter sp. NCu2D-2 TaxID=1608473 RepID=UPI0007CDE3C4|nr:ParB/RepB/Spo0J family partition protein [Acinetobacter sp. NCu2D-2]ANF83365.1 partitioning protein [Acinetobacter sp. NCu2D-2]
MASAKELLAQRLKQNTEKHQQAQQETIKDQKEFRRNVSISDITKSPNQPRKIFNQTELQELADSISEVGLLQPITVRKLGNSKFELIAGERRLRAHQLLNKNTIEVIIIDANDEEASLLTLAENLKRQDLSDYEIFLGLDALHEDLKKNKQKLAKSLGLNREDMYKYLSFEKLPPVILGDLNTMPNLLGRSAATAFKKFLSDHSEDLDVAVKALLGAWEQVKAKKLEQSKAVTYATKLLTEKNSKVPSTSLVRKIQFEGKVAGNIKMDTKQLKVSLNVSEIDEEDLESLENLLKKIIEKNKKV